LIVMFGLPAAPSTLLIVRIVPKCDTEWITIEIMIKTPDPNLTDQVSRQSQREKQSVLSEKESRQLLLGLDAVNAFDHCARNTRQQSVVEIVIIVPRIIFGTWMEYAIVGRNQNRSPEIRFPNF